MTVDAVATLSITPYTALGGERAAKRSDADSQRDAHAQLDPARVAPSGDAPLPQFASQFAAPYPLHTIDEVSADEYVDVGQYHHQPPPAAFAPPAAHPAACACAFCGTLGTPRSCGGLSAVTLDSRPAAVHHACALWAPQVYQPEVRAAPQ